MGEHIFTDGSKLDGKVECGIHSSMLSINMAMRLPGHLQRFPSRPNQAAIKAVKGWTQEKRCTEHSELCAVCRQPLKVQSPSFENYGLTLAPQILENKKECIANIIEWLENWAIICQKKVYGLRVDYCRGGSLIVLASIVEQLEKDVGSILGFSIFSYHVIFPLT